MSPVADRDFGSPAAAVIGSSIAQLWNILNLYQILHSSVAYFSLLVHNFHLILLRNLWHLPGEICSPSSFDFGSEPNFAGFFFKQHAKLAFSGIELKNLFIIYVLL